MAQQTSVKSRPVEDAVEHAECVHHWIIDPPNGPFSEGVCQLCGEVRDFRNHIFYSAWDAENSPYSQYGGINVDD